MRVLIALALFGLLVLAMGCAQKAGAGTPGGGGGGVQPSNITAEDIGGLEDPDSESLDTGIPLEDL